MRSPKAFVSRWTLLNTSLREVLERLGATDALSLPNLEDGACDDFVKEGAPEEARGDFELLIVSARESLKVRVAQLAARLAEKLATDYTDWKRWREAERRDPVGEQRQCDDDGDVVMGRLPRIYGSRLRLAASPAPQAQEEAETSDRHRWASELGKLISTTPTPAATLLARTAEALDRLGAGGAWTSCVPVSAVFDVFFTGSERLGTSRCRPRLSMFWTTWTCGWQREHLDRR